MEFIIHYLVGDKYNMTFSFLQPYCKYKLFKLKMFVLLFFNQIPQNIRMISTNRIMNILNRY